MQPVLLTLFNTAILIATGVTASVPRSAGSSLATFETLQTVPGTSNLENLAIRHTGDILVTSTGSNVLYQVSPHNSTPPIIVANISDALGLFGIVELQRDVFYVVGSKFAGSAVAPGSNGVWKIDMRPFKTSAAGSVLRLAAVSLAAQLPDAMLLNGLSRYATSDSTHLLVADSRAGNIVILDTLTGMHSIFASDPTMAPLATGLNIGINGLIVRGDTIYYTSLDQGLFASLEISRLTGSPIGPVTIIGTGIVNGDDFALSPDGLKAFIANNGQFTVTEVDIVGRSTRLVANSSYLEAASAAKYAGKGCGGRIPLYITGAKTLSGNETVGRVTKACLPDY